MLARFPEERRASFRCSFFVLHDCSQSLQSAMDVSLHRSHRSSGHQGDLGIVEADHVTEDYRLADRETQLSEPNIPGHPVWRLGIVTPNVEELFGDSRAPGTVSQMVAPQIEGDGPNPTPQRKVADPIG